MRELMEAMRVMRQKVMAEADYVGDRFAEEARRIHYEEANALLEEGIMVAPLPRLPEDGN